MDRGVADDAVADLAAAGLELRLDQGHDQAAAGAEALGHRPKDPVQRDERNVDHREIHGRGQHAGSQRTGVGPLHGDDPRVVAQGLGELAAAHVHRVHAARSPLQQQVREAARGRADVQTCQPDRLDAERVERGPELQPASRDERRRRFHLEADRRLYEIARLSVRPRGRSLADTHVAAED